MKRNFSTKTKNVLYVSWLFVVSFQALWTLILYSGWIINSGIVNQYLDFIGASQHRTNSDYVLPLVVAKPLEMAVIVGVFVIIGLIFARAPKTTAHVTIRATTEATKSIEPVVSQVTHKKLTKKNRRFMTVISRFVLSTLIFLVTLPMIFITDGISPAVIFVLSGLLWLTSIVILSTDITHRHMSR